jgi:hypothetical protein
MDRRPRIDQHRIAAAWIILPRRTPREKDRAVSASSMIGSFVGGSFLGAEAVDEGDEAEDEGDELMGYIENGSFNVSGYSSSNLFSLGYITSSPPAATPVAPSMAAYGLQLAWMKAEFERKVAEEP